MFQEEKQTVGRLELTAETAAEQSLEADLHLPDYCPEISRILRCAVEPSVGSFSLQGDQIAANGTATVRLLYLDAEGNPAAYEQSYPLQRQLRAPENAQDCVLTLQVRTEYTNCRALDPRRVEVRAMLSFVLTGACCRKEQLLSGVSGGGMQTQTADDRLLDLIGLSEKSFVLSEVAEIPADRAPISRVLHVGASVLIDETKLISNKALIKGDCEVTAQYLAENGAVESLVHHLPVSQIIELDGLTESSLLQLTPQVTATEAVLKADASGAMRMLELSVSVHASAAAFLDKTLTLLTDAYSTSGSTELRRRPVELATLDQQFRLSFTNQVVLESIGVAVGRVLAVWCSDLRFSSTMQEQSCCLRGTYSAEILYEDQSDTRGFLQKTVSFEDRIPLKGKAERLTVLADLQLLAAACIVTGDSRMELRTEIAAQGMILSISQQSCVSELQLQPAASQAGDKTALTLYFSEPGETLWEIARHYQTTVAAIKEENQLEDDVIKEKAMLLIPAVNE